MNINLVNPKHQLIIAVIVLTLAIGGLYTKSVQLETKASEGTQTLALQKNDHVRGNRNADILIFEFSDLECPFCAKVHPTLGQLVNDYNGQVGWVFSHFPLSMHPGAAAKAMAAECVAQTAGSEGFWGFIDQLFEDGTQVPVSSLASIAIQHGADEKKFQACLDRQETKSIVDNDSALGSAYGVSGTPGSIVLNTKTGETQLVSGAVPYEQFKQIIDSML